MGARILVVDHHDSHRGDIRRLFDKSSHELFFAKDSQTGVAAARQHRPHIVLCEVAPPANGVQLLLRLRIDPSFDDMPIVAVTRFSDPGDRNSFLNLGFAGVITKPVNDAFLGQVEGFLPK